MAFMKDIWCYSCQEYANIRHKNSEGDELVFLCKRPLFTISCPVFVGSCWLMPFLSIRYQHHSLTCHHHLEVCWRQFLDHFGGNLVQTVLLLPLLRARSCYWRQLLCFLLVLSAGRFHYRLYTSRFKKSKHIDSVCLGTRGFETRKLSSISSVFIFRYKTSLLLTK